MSKFVMNKDDWDKIHEYCNYAYDKYSSEIGGYLTVSYEDDRFVFHSPVILEQEISGGNTEITAEALAEYYMKVDIENTGKPYWLCWWHSHHTMGVFWSATDDAAIASQECNNYTFALVTNLKREQILRVSDWKTGIQTDTEVEILGDKFEVSDETKKEVDTLCKEEKVVIKKVGSPIVDRSVYYGDYNGWGSQVSIWKDQVDQEKVDLEADIDNILIDYQADDDYDTCRKRFANLNRKQGHKKSELRVALLDKKILDKVINSALADEYIYPKGTKHNVENMIANAELDDVFNASFERSSK